MPFAETAAAIGAGISALGSAAGAISGATSNRRGYKWSKRFFNEVTLPQWERELVYNSPINQMALRRAAGLNPQLVDGISSAAGSPNIQRVPDQQDLSGFVGMGEAIRGGLMQFLQAKQMQKNLDLTDQQIRKASADADVARQLANGNYGGFRAQSVAQSLDVATHRMSLMAHDIALRKHQADQITANIKQIDSRIQVNSASIAKILSDIDINAVRQSLMRSQVAVNSGRITLQQAQVYAGIENTNARTDVERINLQIMQNTGSNPGSGGIIAWLARAFFEAQNP